MALPFRHKKSWSEREIDQLKEFYRKRVPHREIASKLRRTLNAIESKALELGISGRGKRKKRVLGR